MDLSQYEVNTTRKSQLAWINELVKRGEVIIQEQRMLDEEKKKQDSIEWENAWNDFLVRAQRWVPDAIADFLVINANYRVGNPPKEVEQFNGFETNIPGLAPIKVVFEISGGSPESPTRAIKKTYTVPSVVKEEDERNEWTFSNKYFSIVGHVEEVTLLEVALAKAKERYDKLMDYLAKSAMQEKEARERAELRSHNLFTRM